MPDALVVVVPALLAGVLLLSGIGKLDRLGEREPLTAWRDLGVPAVLQRRGLAVAHPIVEVVLAIAVLVTGGVAHVVAAAVVLALMLAYAALVAFALRRPVTVECSCFGARRSAPVTRHTLWRNLWLSVLAGGGVAAAVLDDRSVVAAVSERGAGWWFVGALVAVVTTVLVLPGRTPSAAPATSPTTPVPSGELADSGDDLDYLRTRTPDVPVTLADGSTTTLRELSSERAVLLLEVSESCGGCVEVIRSIPTWRAELPEIDLRVLVTSSPDASALTSTLEPQSVHDSSFHVSRSFGYAMTPTAVLLGADGLLAGGPVVGDAAIRELIAEIGTELRAAANAANDVAGDVATSPVHSHEAG